MTQPNLDANWETPCPKREDGRHCDCWYDGQACCACGAAAESQEVLNEDISV